MKCRFCMEEIIEGAIKCKHCKSNLTPTRESINNASVNIKNNNKGNLLLFTEDNLPLYKNWIVILLVSILIIVSMIILLDKNSDSKITSYILVFIYVSAYPILIVVFFVKVYKYTLGKYSDFIYVPSLLIISGIISIFIPIINWLVVGYTIFWCKSMPKLISSRESAIKTLTPAIIVEATEELILNNDLTGDIWVKNTWNKNSKSYWVKRLSSNPDLLRQTLQAKLQVHVSTLEPIANWVEMVKHFNYLEERK